MWAPVAGRPGRHRYTSPSPFAADPPTCFEDTIFTGSGQVRYPSVQSHKNVPDSDAQMEFIGPAAQGMQGVLCADQHGAEEDRCPIDQVR